MGPISTWTADPLWRNWALDVYRYHWERGGVCKIQLLPKDVKVGMQISGQHRDMMAMEKYFRYMYVLLLCRVGGQSIPWLQYHLVDLVAYQSLQYISTDSRT
jgi:hypothetical protein